MPVRVQYTWEAREDLLDLFALIARDGGDERAESILRRLRLTAAALADWPGIGRVRSDLEGQPRTFAVWPWLIVYEAQPSDNGIFIWRIVDGRRDLTDLIHPPRPS